MNFSELLVNVPVYALLILFGIIFLIMSMGGSAFGMGGINTERYGKFALLTGGLLVTAGVLTYMVYIFQLPKSSLATPPKQVAQPAATVTVSTPPTSSPQIPVSSAPANEITSKQPAIVPDANTQPLPQMPQPAKEVATPTPPEISSSIPGKYAYASTQYLEKKELHSFTPEELEMIKSEILARHGYIFEPGTIKEYFTTQAWYQPRYTDVSAMLTAIEKENLKLIEKEHEKHAKGKKGKKKDD